MNCARDVRNGGRLSFLAIEMPWSNVWIYSQKLPLTCLDPSTFCTVWIYRCCSRSILWDCQRTTRESNELHGNVAFLRNCCYECFLVVQAESLMCFSFLGWKLLLDQRVAIALQAILSFETSKSLCNKRTTSQQRTKLCLAGEMPDSGPVTNGMACGGFKAYKLSSLSLGDFYSSTVRYT